MDGRKLFEFRKVIFREPVNEVVVYATTPVQRVVGTFTIEEIHSDSLDSLWKRTAQFAGITRIMFDEYFGGRCTGHAIQVAQVRRFAVPQPLSRYVASNIAPQSFCYV